MKVACLLLSHLPFEAEVKRHLELKGQPAIIFSTEGSRRIVVDFSPGLIGIQKDMPLQQTLSVARGAKLIESDPAYYKALFNEILETLEQRSPVVEEEELGLVYVDLSGLEELYGGETRMVTALHNAVPPYFSARLGIGVSKFVSYLAAISTEPGRAIKAPKDTGEFLKSFPVDVLPVGFKTKVRLHQLGLNTLGDVASLSLGPLQAQFGPEGRLIWELANGIDSRPLTPRKPVEAITESLTFPSPTANLGGILLGIEALLGRAFLRPELRGRYSRLSILTGEVWQRAPWVKRITYKEPVGSKERALYRIKSVLLGAEFPGPLESIIVTLTDLTGEYGRQESLFWEVRKREQLRDVMKQMEAVFGKPAPIFQVREVEPWSRIPERRHALVQYAP